MLVFGTCGAFKGGGGVEDNCVENAVVESALMWPTAVAFMELF